MQDKTPPKKDKGLAEASRDVEDDGGSAESSQHREDESEIGDRVGGRNDPEQGRNGARKIAKVDVR